MKEYQIIKEIGRGAFGFVWGALDKQTGEVVAIKELKGKCNYSEEECKNLTEIKALRKMNHPNIVKLKGYKQENNTLYLVFEYMECNLYDKISSVKSFSEDEIKNMCFQIFQGLAHMHGNGYFHRDLKPENLLVSKNVVKIADFGQAHEINGEPPYAYYIGTRSYRAPEVLLRSGAYDSAVDMWAMGVIMAELFTLQQLFPGGCSRQVMYEICRVIGGGVPLNALMPSASSEALSLISALLSWNPCMRPTAMEALKHPFFFSCYNVQKPFHRSQDLPWKQALLTPAKSWNNCAVDSEEEDPIMEDIISRLSEFF